LANIHENLLVRSVYDDKKQKRTVHLLLGLPENGAKLNFLEEVAVMSFSASVK
jgi:hypothetical protein